MDVIYRIIHCQSKPDILNGLRKQLNAIQPILNPKFEPSVTFIVTYCFDLMKQVYLDLSGIENADLLFHNHSIYHLSNSALVLTSPNYFLISNLTLKFKIFSFVGGKVVEKSTYQHLVGRPQILDRLLASIRASHQVPFCLNFYFIG